VDEQSPFGTFFYKLVKGKRSVTTISRRVKRERERKRTTKMATS
jgi:hypothetical protein